VTQQRVPAPLYVDTFDLCAWLLDRFDGDSGSLNAKICQCALDLLGAVTLALKGRRRDEQLDNADELLITLRTYLRLAETCSQIETSQMLHALERCDAVGRQLGGWMKSLGPV